MYATPLRTATAALTLGLALSATAAPLTHIDSAASQLQFSYTQMGVKMDGKFAKFDGTLNFDPARPEAAHATLDIPLISIDAGSAEANDEVKGKTWFNTASFPSAHFETTQVKALGNNRFELDGKLTIKGHTQPVRATVNYTSQGAKGSFDGGFTLQRTSFSIGEGEWADTSIVANDIQVKFHILAQ